MGCVGEGESFIDREEAVVMSLVRGLADAAGCLGGGHRSVWRLYWACVTRYVVSCYRVASFRAGGGPEVVA